MYAHALFKLSSGKFGLRHLVLLVLTLLLLTAWTDNPITTQTPIRTIHITELRQAIDNKRMSCGMPPFTWTNPLLTADSLSTPVRAIHMNELRTAMRQFSFPTPPTFSNDPVSANMTPIRAIHINELRNLMPQAQCPCNCTGWTNGACAAAGGCPPGQRRQSRTCNPLGCSAQAQCVVDPTCNNGVWTRTTNSCNGNCNQSCTQCTGSIGNCSRQNSNCPAPNPAGMPCTSIGAICQSCLINSFCQFVEWMWCAQFQCQ